VCTKSKHGSIVIGTVGTPKGASPYPSVLQDLLKDPRYSIPRRHLRKLYCDPITGNDQWGLVPAIGFPGIMGVYSLSELKPIKVGNFEAPFQTFEGRTSYRDWKFMVVPSPLPSSPPVLNALISSSLLGV
jgi:hypothetical protein